MARPPKKTVKSELEKEDKKQQVVVASSNNYDVALASLFQAHKATASCDDVSSLSRSGRGVSANEGGLTSLFPNISSAPQPFHYSAGDYISHYDTIDLAVKAYFAFALLRNVIEVMVELANSPIKLRGGSKKTKDFVSIWLKKVGMGTLADQFMREYFRSGNVHLYGFEANVRPEELKQLESLYSGMGSKIPLKYTILNPLYVHARANLNYDRPEYVRVLQNFEIERLKNPQTPEDRAILESLSEKDRKDLKSGARIKLDQSKLTTILYKAQPYDFFGVPLCFPVLEAIDAKMDLLKIDRAVARTTDRMILLITMGKEATQYDQTTINPAAMSALQQMFNQNSIGRALVSDYTTQLKFIVPPINDILGKEKYEQLDADILIGLNAIFFSVNEKFANSSIKVQVFIERLREARRIFLEKFLQPQIDKVVKIINAKSAPQAEFEEVNLRDELSYAKLSVTMFQAGLLTAEETLEALNSGYLPTAEESLESQKQFADFKQDGLYMATVGGATELQRRQIESNIELAKNEAVNMATPGAAGRPQGTKSPRSSNKVTPIGASVSEGSPKEEGEGGKLFSFAALKDLSWTVSEVQNKTEGALKKKFKIKQLDEAQLKICRSIVSSIISNEPKDSWVSCIKGYLEEPKDTNEKALKEIDELCDVHNIDAYAAAILRLSGLEYATK